MLRPFLVNDCFVVQLFYEISLLSTAIKKSAVFQNFYRANRNALPEPILSMFNRKYGRGIVLCLCTMSLSYIAPSKRKETAIKICMILQCANHFHQFHHVVRTHANIINYY